MRYLSKEETLKYQKIAVLASVYAKRQPIVAVKPPVNIAHFTLVTLQEFSQRGIVRLQGDRIIKTPRGREYWKVIARRHDIHE